MVLRNKSPNNKTNKSEKNDTDDNKVLKIDEPVKITSLIERFKDKKMKRRPSFKCVDEGKYWCSICEQHNKQCVECEKDTENLKYKFVD